MGSPNRKQLVNAAGAAETLYLSVHTVRQYVSQGILPHYKIGAKVMFDPEELSLWLESKRVAPRCP